MFLLNLESFLSELVDGNLQVGKLGGEFGLVGHFEIGEVKKISFLRMRLKVVHPNEFFNADTAHGALF